MEGQLPNRVLPPKVNIMEAVYSATAPLNIKKWSNIKNQMSALNKPTGGVWLASPEYTWKLWCEQNMFANPDEMNNYHYLLPENLNTYTINTDQDYLNLRQQYPLQVPQLGIQSYDDMLKDKLDFEKLAENYDILHVTDHGLNTGKNRPGLWGYDLESYLVLNKTALKNIIDHTIQQTKNQTIPKPIKLPVKKHHTNPKDTTCERQ